MVDNVGKSHFAIETIERVEHWTDRLFSFRCSRDPAFRFTAGQFVMLGLPLEDKPLLRAYSVASATWEDHLEFLSIKVPDGPLTSRLRNIKPGDPILMGRKATGTLLIDNLLPGRVLWLIATGTGLAPFLSLIQEPSLYERFERVVVSHTVRQVAELAYRDLVTIGLPQHELLGEMATRQLLYYPSVTREPFPVCERPISSIESGRAAADLGLPPLSAESDRMMICGGPQMLADAVALLKARGFREGSTSTPGQYVVEKAFVER